MAESNGLTLEDVLAGPGYAALDASPLQRAICRAADGLPVGDALDAEQLEQHFGRWDIPSVRPRLVVVVAGVRGGKSWIASCAGIKLALTVPLGKLKKHELPRVAIIAPTVDAARATFVILVGILSESPVLGMFVEGDPTADTVVLKRPDGRRVEIVVVAAHRGGLSVRNRWLAGFVLDEVAQFGSEAEGRAVNVEELLRAAETRLLDGAQGWLISSPYGRAGLLHELFQRHHGKPGDVLVVHAPTRALNPSFPQELIDAVALRDPDAAAREYGAEWLDPESAMLPGELVDPAIRDKPRELQPAPGWKYVAAIDPATRGNAWSLVIIGIAPKGQTPRLRVALAREWKGSAREPLNPEHVFEKISELAHPYGVRSVKSDQAAADYLRAIARREGLSVHDKAITAPIKLELYEGLRTHLAIGNLELPPVPQLRADLLAIRKRVTAGAISVHLPKTPDGRHCDYASALALAVQSAVFEARTVAVSTSGQREAGAPGGLGPFGGGNGSSFEYELRDGHVVRTNRPRRQGRMTW